MDASRDPLILLDQIEGENAAQLAASRRRRIILRTALETLMAATENLGDVATRLEADEAAREQTDTARHAHVQELRQSIAELQAQLIDLRTQLDQVAAGMARLNTVATNIEASTAAEQADTTEPPAPV